MLPQFPAVTRCMKCSGYYWVRDAPEVGEMNVFVRGGADVPDAWNNAHEVAALDVEGYHDALQKGLGKTTDQERYLRVHLWWLYNDPGRMGGKVIITSNYRDNCTQLLRLLSIEDPNDIIMTAEIHRELGDFETAKWWLAKLPKKYQGIVDKLKQFASAKDSLVRQL